MAHEDPRHRVVRTDRHEPRPASEAGRPRGVRRRQAPEHVDGRVPVPAPGPRRPLLGVPARDQRRRVPEGRPRRPPGSPREGAPARAAPAAGTRERCHDVQRARVRAAAADPDRVLVEPRGVRGRPPIRGVRRGRRGLRVHGEHVLRVEDRRRGVRLLVRAVLRAPLPRVPLLQRLRALRQRFAPDGARDPALHPLDAPGRADHDLRRESTRRSISPTSTTASTASSRASKALAEGRVVNQTINLAYGQGNTLVHCAERIALRARSQAAGLDRALPPRRGDALRCRPVEGARAPRRCAQGAPRRGHRTLGRMVPRAPRGASRRGRVDPWPTTRARSAAARPSGSPRRRPDGARGRRSRPR